MILVGIKGLGSGKPPVPCLGFRSQGLQFGVLVPQTLNIPCPYTLSPKPVGFGVPVLRQKESLADAAAAVLAELRSRG